MHIPFTKMQGLGNDFVVIDGFTQPVHMTVDLAKKISDRHYGIGCDQVLLITPPDNNQADFGYQIFNADGSEVFQCGNGARCVGLFIQQKKLSDKKIVVLATKRSELSVSVHANNQVEVTMPAPSFNPDLVPFVTETENPPYNLLIDGREIMFDVVNVGNPHAIITVKELDLSDIERFGEKLSQHNAFPEETNVGFMQIISKDEISLAVYERGAGLTQACGSGAVAAVAVGQKNKQLSEKVCVRQSGGDVFVIAKKGLLSLLGPAEFVFEGVF